MVLNPRPDAIDVQLAAGDSQHEGNDLVRSGLDVKALRVQERVCYGETRSLVAVGEWMVLGKAPQQESWPLCNGAAVRELKRPPPAQPADGMTTARPRARVQVNEDTCRLRARMKDKDSPDEAHPYRAFLPIFPRPQHDQPISSAKGWRSRFDRRHSGMWLSSPGPFASLEAFVVEARTRAEKRLDMLSVMGAGHHVVPYRHRDVLALQEDRGRQNLLIRSPHILSVPYGIRSRSADDPEADEPAASTAKHHPSMRYFRLAQVSADAFGCFVYLYRALESILDEIHPYEQGREKEWFSTAIAKALHHCQPDTVEALGDYATPEAFTRFVYEEVRNAIFHAKTKSRIPLAPLDIPATRPVRTASRLVSLVVVDLLKAYLPIGRGERIKSDLDMHESSDVPRNLEGLRLLIDGGRAHNLVFPFRVERDDENLGHLLIGEQLQQERIPQAPIVGAQVVSADGTGPRVVFDGRIDGSALDSLTVQIFMAVDFELGHRTAGWIPEDGVRVAARPNPKAPAGS